MIAGFIQIYITFINHWGQAAPNPPIMAKQLELLRWPDPRLNQQSSNVDYFDQSLRDFCDDLILTMNMGMGIAIAAPQVGRLDNLIIVGLPPGHQPLIMVNPEILSASDEVFAFDEGCLSVPGYYEKRKRPAEIKVKYQNVDGEEKIEDYYKVMAFVIQHEIDHLKGVVFVDGSSQLKQRIIIRKINKTTRKFKNWTAETK